MSAVVISELTKRFGRQLSLDSCSFSVPTGCTFGLLGPNGAGKSTLIRTLLGFVRPSSGTAQVNGFDVLSASLQVRQNVSYLPGDARLYRSLKGVTLIDMFAELHPQGDAQQSRQIARRLDLDTSRRVAFMSTGMRQKLALAIVLGCQAPVLILDEPTANLDPDVRAEFLQILRGLQASGRTILLTSHVFSDIDDSCDHVAILRKGRLVATHDLSSLRGQHVVTATLGQQPTTQQLSLLRTDHVQQLDVVASPDATAYQLRVRLTGRQSQWLGWLDQLRDWELPAENLRVQPYGTEHLYADALACETARRYPS